MQVAPQVYRVAKRSLIQRNLTLLSLNPKPVATGFMYPPRPFNFLLGWTTFLHLRTNDRNFNAWTKWYVNQIVGVVHSVFWTRTYQKGEDYNWYIGQLNFNIYKVVMTENGTSEVCFTHVVTSASWLTFSTSDVQGQGGRKKIRLRLCVWLRRWHLSASKLWYQMGYDFLR